MANFYFLNTGDANWSNVNNWSNSDGGAPVGSLPTSIDDVFFTALSGNCNEDLTTQNIKTFTCTGYSKIFNLVGGGLGVAGNIVLGSGMKITGEGGSLLMTATGSLITSGIIIPYFRTATSNLTITLLDQLNVSNTLTMASNISVIWAGAFGFVTNNFSISSTTGNTITFQAGNTYKIRGKYTHGNEKGSAHGKVISSTPGTKAILTVTGDTNIGYVDFTDTDASGGRTLYPFNGVVTNCNNIVSMTDKFWTNKTVASSSII